MKCVVWVSLSIMLVSNAYAASLPGDSAKGKRLLEANCMECHQTDVYTRKNRKVRSLAALKEQATNCAHMATKEFSAIEMQDLVKYLNDQFYHFN